MMVRLQKEKRREQLLDVAMDMVREGGADHLTLVTLAERAAVSRPVAYEHFGTRSGLLLALYQRLENSYVEALRRALAEAPGDLSGLARIISAAYFDCLAHSGAEGPALSAALQGSEEMAAQQRLMLADYVEIMRVVLEPHSALAPDTLRLRCIGLLGAAEAIAREQQCGRIATAEAVLTFAAMIEGTVDRTGGLGNVPGR